MTNFDRLALSICAASALLSGCSVARQAQGDLPPTATNDSGGAKHKIFDYIGTQQTFIVPTGVTRLTVVARGGIGSGSSAPPSYQPPGYPGRVYAVIHVRPGEKLYVFVGGSGPDGGFNGGGAGGKSGYGGGTGNRGGGASDVRRGGDSLKNRIIVAAGGGGSGSAFIYGGDQGGDGGGLIGKPGGGYGGYGGGGGTGATQSSGGTGGAGGKGDEKTGDGTPGAAGTLGSGGGGGNGGAGTNYDHGLPGGGGGGGYYGGGGGGGGSSYVEPGAITSRMWTGWRTNGDGLVTFSWN
jgi:hypothetical protein